MYLYICNFFFLRFFNVLKFFFLYLYINSFNFAKKNEMKPMDLMNMFCRNYMIFARIFPSNEFGVGLWFVGGRSGRAPPPLGSSPWMVHQRGGRHCRAVACGLGSSHQSPCSSFFRTCKMSCCMKCFVIFFNLSIQ